MLQERLTNDSLTPIFGSDEKIEQSEAELHAQQLTPDSMNSNDQTDDLFGQSKAISDNTDRLSPFKDDHCDSQKPTTQNLNQPEMAANTHAESHNPCPPVDQSNVKQNGGEIFGQSHENIDETPTLTTALSQSYPAVSTLELKNIPGAPYGVEDQPQKSPSGGESETTKPAENPTRINCPKLPPQKSKQPRKRKTKNGKVKNTKLPKRPKMARKSKKCTNAKPNLDLQKTLSEKPKTSENFQINSETLEKVDPKQPSESEDEMVKTEISEDSENVKIEQLATSQGMVYTVLRFIVIYNISH